jgi:hypothetical protein
MKSSNGLLRIAGVVVVTLTGAFLFFDIIGVFGQEAAIAGLLLFVVTAIVICHSRSADGERP